MANTKVTQELIADDAIGADQLAASAVVTASIVNNAITSAKLDTNLTVAGEISVTTLDIGGTNVTSTAAELNFSDGVTSNIQTQLDTKATTGKAIAMALVFG